MILSIFMPKDIYILTDVGTIIVYSRSYGLEKSLTSAHTSKYLSSNVSECFCKKLGGCHEVFKDAMSG